MTIDNRIFYSILIFTAFIVGIIARLNDLISLGDFLILLMLEMGFLALINKEQGVEK